MGTNEKTSADVEECAKAAAAAPRKKFPTPQYVVVIYCRTVVTVDREAVDKADDRVETAWNSHLVADGSAATAAGGSAASSGGVVKKKKKIRVKMQSVSCENY